MKIKTIKKNNNPRNITTKHNKKTNKKTNKKGKSNILKKTKKINRKNKKLLIGGKYNENFFSVVLDDNFEKSIDENSFLYKFMEKYIKNLNPETNIPNEFVYEKYRNYKKKYDSKLYGNKPYFQDPRPKILQKGQPDYLIKSMNWLIDTYRHYYKEKPITQNLRDIRLDYYLKTVVSIIMNDTLRNFFSKYKPIDLYTEINGIKNNYDTNIKSELEKTDSKSSYYIYCHGGYSKNPIIFTVPENVMIHFLTPLNYVLYSNVNESRNLHKNLTKISKNTDNTINNIKELLKIDCFQNMITFLPGQKCFDIYLSIALKDKETFNHTLGIYNITSDDSSDKPIEPIEPYIFDQSLSYLIQNNIRKSDSITNIYINCCRSCNNEVDNLTIENMYIYENFIKQFNNSLLEINEKDIEIDEVVCPNSMALKVLSIEKSPRNNTGPAFNGYLSQKKDKTKSPTINKIIKLSKNPTTDQNKEKLSKLINSTEFTDDEFENLFNYLTDQNKANIIDIIHNNLITSKQKKFINDVYIKSSTNKHFLIILNHLLTHLKKTYLNLDINLTNSIGNTALHNAVLKNKLEIVKLLLAQDKIEVNIPNNEGKTPLYYAVLENKLEIVELLLKHQKIDVNLKNNIGKTPLYYAVLENKAEIVKLLLEHKKIDVNSKIIGMTPLHLALIGGHTEIVKLLLEHKDIKVNIPNNKGDTPLHWAALQNNLEIVKSLLAHPDIDVNLKNDKGETPLHLTKTLNQPEIIELIKTHKSSSQ